MVITSVGRNAFGTSIIHKSSHLFLAVILSCIIPTTSFILAKKSRYIIPTQHDTTRYSNINHAFTLHENKSGELVPPNYDTDANNKNRTVTILSRGPHHIIAMKPPSVICHHSNWAGSKGTNKQKLKIGEEPEIPMLQRVRDAINSLDYKNLENEDDKDRKMKRVNLVHRLDRGASGALLFAFADDDDDDNNTDGDAEIDNNEQNITTDDYQQQVKKIRKKGATARLQAEMQKTTSTKTYVALVRGEGILKGEDLKQKGWFEVNRPIKDEKGRLNEATTLFRFVAGQAEPQQLDDGSVISEEERLQQPRLSLVLARPQHGRWHQIRRHLNGLSHPILGDTSHGSSKTNREWKEKRNLPGERICLHLARLQIPSTEFTETIDCSCPLPKDILDMLNNYAPNVLKEAMPLLESEGILMETPNHANYQVGTYKIPDRLLNQMMGIESEFETLKTTKVKILSKSQHYVVASKPPGVVVHHSSWTNKRKNEATPMVQQVRNEIGKKVNPIHRLDRSASGCLIFSLPHEDNNARSPTSCDVTKALIDSLQSDDATKTYLALCDGDGYWNGVNFLEKGWFTLDQPVKDENGKAMDALTDFCFVVSVRLPSVDGSLEGNKATLVLARPKTGKYHQIRQHLASGRIGHAIIGDSSHGRSRTNRIWKKYRHLQKERTCLHLMKVKLPPTKYSPDGIVCSCPIPDDMLKILKEMPSLLERTGELLLEEQ